MIEQETLPAVDLDGQPTALSAEAIDALAHTLRGELLRRGDTGYDEARRVWNGMIDKYPALIARCSETADVVACVTFARAHRLRTAVRGGGHNAAGNATCDGGLVIDLSPMRVVEVDTQERIARAQGGATWADLDAATQAYGLATPGGAVSTTGIAGLTLSGGIGMLRRLHGLSCDNLIAAEMVTADGQVRTLSAEEHPDLFWAIRGGGGNFGVVTEFFYDLHPVGPEILFLLVMYPASEAGTVVPAWRDFMATAPEALSCNGFFTSVPPAPMFPAAAHGQPVFTLAGMWAGDIQEGLEVLAPLNLRAPTSRRASAASPD